MPLSYRQTWSYDAFNNVTSFVDGRTNVTTFSYDSRGNRSRKPSRRRHAALGP